LIVIPSIRFTKLIIHHLQRKHRFHPRPNSPLHLSNEEPVLGFLKFSAKGTKREIVGMPIPSKLITANIREAPYYQEYQENVAKHRGFLAGETKGTQDLPAPKSAKPAKKPQSTAQKAPLKHSISSPVTSTQPAPTSVPVNTQENKCKQAKEQLTSPLKPKGLNVADEDADFQKAVEESMKDAYALPKDNKKESEKIVLGIEKGSQDEGQTGPDPNAQAEGHTGSDTGQAGPDPANAEARIQSTSSTVVHVGSDHEHMDLDVANVSPQPSTEQLYEGFTTTVYPNVQENLKLAVEEPVLLEEPASSSGTLSSLQHLSRDFSFGDQFFSDKPSDADKSAETKVESMANVPIQQALSSISLMTSTIVDLTSRPESPKEHQQLKATTTDTTTTTTTTLPPP
nr:histone deacetylase 14 [Tanacetum cinerariifolium]